MQRSRSFFLIVIIAMLAGCSSQRSAVRSTITPVSQTNQTPTPIVINQTPLTVAQAWGNVHITQLPITFGSTIFQAGGNVDDAIITDDDQVCGVTKPSANNIPQDNLVESLALLNLHTGALTRLLTLPTGHLLMNCAVTGQWIIWSDQYSYLGGGLYMHWSVRALNRQTLETRALDASKPSGATSNPTKITPFPVASNGKAIWLTDSANPADQAVALYDFANGHTTILAHHATYPLLAWPWASWGDTTSNTIVFANLVTQQHVTLKQAPSLAAFNGAAFAVSDTHYRSLMLYPTLTDGQNGAPVTVPMISQFDYVANPTINARLMTWQSTVNLFAFDRKLQRMVQIGALTNPEPAVASHFMLWTQENGRGQLMLDVIDTNTLP